jgi:molybdopterin-synthase adenylyltransferase
MPLGDRQIERYSRQIIVPGIGGRGQERLLAASVAVAGSDELARTVALYAAGAGVGRIEIVSPSLEWRGLLGTDVADLNPDVRIALADGAGESAFSSAHDAVFASADSLEQLIRISRAAGNAPLVTAGIAGGGGWLTASSGSDGPCPVCAALEQSASATADGAEHATTAAVLGSLAAVALLRELLGIGERRRRAWLCYDARSARLEERVAEPKPECGLCANR